MSQTCEVSLNICVKIILDKWKSFVKLYSTVPMYGFKKLMFFIFFWEGEWSLMRISILDLETQVSPMGSRNTGPWAVSPRVCVSRKLEFCVELRLPSRHSDLGYKHPTSILPNTYPRNYFYGWMITWIVSAVGCVSSIIITLVMNSWWLHYCWSKQPSCREHNWDREQRPGRCQGLRQAF